MNGKLHGDLRSVNIMLEVTETGEAVLVDDNGSGNSRANIKVIDFDWAGDVGKTLIGVGLVRGTEENVAQPQIEQLMGIVSPRLSRFQSLLVVS